ncbi:MAG TPA: hypothetical protein VF432_30040 [Thermoanaerobaculia bacterium]
MLANIVVMEPRLSVPLRWTGEDFFRASGLSSAFLEGEPVRAESQAIAGSALNASLSTFVERGATKVIIPATASDAWAHARRLRELAAPSFRKRLRIVDRTGGLWSAVDRYFEPMYESVMDSVGLITPKSDFDQALTIEATWTALHQLAWQTYLLILASREQAEVDLGVDVSHGMISSLENAKFSAEAAARLAVLAALRAGYTNNVNMPGFAASASNDAAFHERVDEMLDDAHFLEVSALRRFFGMAQNKRAILRDLRLLTRFIVRHKRWAKGVLRLATHHSVFSSGSAEALQAIAPESFRGEGRPPLIVDSESLFPNRMLFNARRAVRGGWNVEIQYLHRSGRALKGGPPLLDR